MRTPSCCLLCGGQLAFLAKVKTGAFCCEEHRDRYHNHVDNLILSRVRQEKARLVRNGSIAPAPLARIIRRSAQLVAAPGGLKSAIAPIAWQTVAMVPGRQSQAACGVPVAPYFNGLQQRGNALQKHVTPEARSGQRPLPHIPLFTGRVVARLNLKQRGTGAVQPRPPRTIESAVQPIAFARPWSAVWGFAPASCRIREVAGEVPVITAKAPPAVRIVIASAAFGRVPAVPQHSFAQAVCGLGSRGLETIRVKAIAPAGGSVGCDPIEFPRAALMPAIEGTAVRLLTTAERLGTTVHAVSSAPPPRALGIEAFNNSALMPAVRCGALDTMIRAEGGLIRSRRLPPARVPAGFEATPPVAPVSDPTVLVPAGPGLRRPTEFQASDALLPLAPVRAAARRIEIVVDPTADAFTPAVLLRPAGRLATTVGTCLPLPGIPFIQPNARRAARVTMVAMRLRPLIPASRLATLGFKSRRLPQHVAELSKAAWRMPSWRRLSIGIPVAAVALAVYLTSDRSNVSLARADTSVISDVVGEVRRDLAGRAAVDLNETFGAGLNQWNGAEKWQTSWSAHTGEALPGKLALYTPSVSLRDYNAEFNGQIAKKALSFVVRARDLDNYLAVRFVAVTPGLMPEVVVERYAVVAGEMSQSVRTQLHMPLAQDSVYHVRIDARGSDFTVYLNGTVADHWTDARFPTGGIGFFTKKGEKARITGLHVWHQDDTVGRLLAKISRDDEKAP